VRGGDVFFNDAVDFVVINGLGAQAEGTRVSSALIGLRWCGQSWKSRR